MTFWDFILCCAFAIYLTSLGGMILHVIQTEMRDWQRRQRLNVRLSQLKPPPPMDGRRGMPYDPFPSGFHPPIKLGRKLMTKGDKI